MRREKPSKMRSDWHRRTSWPSASLSTWTSRAGTLLPHFNVFTQQLQKTPQSPAAHFLEGKVYAAQGQWDPAEAALLKTLELDPNSSSAYDLLISIYVAANKLPQAITQLDSLLSKSPDNARALMLSALTYEKMNEFAKAKDAYEKLLSAKPDFPPVLNNLAYLYAERLDELDKAYDLAQKARALQPERCRHSGHPRLDPLQTGRLQAGPGPAARKRPESPE